MPVNNSLTINKVDNILKSLNLVSNSIENITGLEYLKNLVELTQRMNMSLVSLLPLYVICRSKWRRKNLNI